MKPIGITRERVSPGTPVPWSNDSNVLDMLFVGSGNAFSEKRGECNMVLGYLGSLTAVDVGRQWIERAKAFGITPARLDAALITHAHSDHVGGLASLAERRRYLHGNLPKLRLIGHPAVLPTVLDGTLAGQIGGHEKGVSAADFFKVVAAEETDERAATAEVAGRFTAELFRTMHDPATALSWRDAAPSTGVFVPWFGLWISGDTRFELGLAESYVARGAEWLFHDVSRSPAVHASLDEVAHLPVDVRRSTYLVHPPDDMSEAEVAEIDFAGLVEPGDLFRFHRVGERIV